MRNRRLTMPDGKEILLILAFLAAWPTFTPVALGHGALSGDADTCVLDIGPFKMHFTGYQPGESGNQEFCEDIPKTGKTIIVLESMDDPLREMQIAARIVSGGPDGPVEVEQPLRSNARGSITLMHTFQRKGDFTGLVTVSNDEREYVAEFPFSVGLPPAKAEDNQPVSGIPVSGWVLIALTAFCVIGVFVFVIRSRPGAQGS